MTTPTPPDVINALLNIQVSLARHDQMLTNIGEDQKEIKDDQKEIKSEQKEIRKEYASLATVVNTMQGQVNTMQVQFNTTQGQVNGLLSWQLAVTQQHGSDTVTTYDRIHEVRKNFDAWLLAKQGATLTVVIGVMVWLFEQFVAPFLPHK